MENKKIKIIFNIISYTSLILAVSYLALFKPWTMWLSNHGSSLMNYEILFPFISAAIGLTSKFISDIF